MVKNVKTYENTPENNSEPLFAITTHQDFMSEKKINLVFKPKSTIKKVKG